MLNSHFVLLIIFSLCVSVVFGTLMRDDVRGGAMVAGKMFAGFVVAAILIGWLMYPFPL